VKALYRERQTPRGSASLPPVEAEKLVEKKIDRRFQKRVDVSGAANIIRDPNAAGITSAASVLEN
jgi:hypothetical protein